MPALFQRVHDSGRAIGGAVVQQQDFNAGVGLLHGRLDTFGQIGFDVVGRSGC